MASSDLADLFVAVTPDGATARAMGGSPAAFVGGNLFMRIRRREWVLRLSPTHREELLRLPGAKAFEPIPGRPMPEYVVVPRRVVDDRETLGHWVERAHTYAASLAPQEEAGIPQAQPRKQAAKTLVMDRRED